MIQIDKKVSFPIKLTPSLIWIYFRIGSLIGEILILALLETGTIAVDVWYVRYIIIALILGTAASIRGINRIFADKQKMVIQNAIFPFLKTEKKWKEITKATIMVEKRIDLTPIKYALESVILESKGKKIYVNHDYKIDDTQKLMGIVSALKHNGVKIEEIVYARTKSS